MAIFSFVKTVIDDGASAIDSERLLDTTLTSSNWESESSSNALFASGAAAVTVAFPAGGAVAAAISCAGAAGIASAAPASGGGAVAAAIPSAGAGAQNACRQQGRRPQGPTENSHHRALLLSSSAEPIGEGAIVPRSHISFSVGSTPPRHLTTRVGASVVWHRRKERGTLEPGSRGSSQRLDCTCSRRLLVLFRHEITRDL